MIRINTHYQKLEADYLFADIARRVDVFRSRHPDREIIRLGIGDVVHALPAACIAAFHRAVDEMASDEHFRGYGPVQGYDFLREAIARHDFQARGAEVDADEIFVSDGAKCDLGSIQEIFAGDTRIALPDPVYPVYADTNVMAGRTGAATDGRYAGLVYLDCDAANGYLPRLPDEPVDLIYLCFPNNPTGMTLTHQQLRQWVDHARDTGALILFDAAYEAFIRDERLPRSIYEIPGAREVAIEFRSFSKTAGFTGVRCAYTVVPRECVARDGAGATVALHALWQRRQATRSNGVAYPVQRAAEAVYSAEGRQQVQTLIDGYHANADCMRRCLPDMGLGFTGGEHSPYVWVDSGRDSWEFFDLLLQEAGVVCTPGAGFGRCGRSHIRLSVFNSAANVGTAMERMAAALVRGSV